MTTDACLYALWAAVEKLPTYRQSQVRELAGSMRQLVIESPDMGMAVLALAIVATEAKVAMEQCGAISPDVT